MKRARRLRLAALTGGLLAVAIGASPASALTGRNGPAGQVAIVITSVSPTTAAPGGKVQVSGLVDNLTGAALPGSLLVQLWSSSTPLATPAAMADYQTAGSDIETQLPGARIALTSPLPAGRSEAWSITLPVSEMGVHAFGVYPLAAQLTQANSPLAVARTFLPFWPSGSHSRRMSIAWVWPLIDTPHRAACAQTLLSNTLAGSLAGQGRLTRLLAAGDSAAGRAADLTWAIDPALVADVSAMTRRYQVSAASCGAARSYPASAAAAAWLHQLRNVTAGQDFFVTPYDDPDVAALAHAGLVTPLKRTFQQGRHDAVRLLGGPQRPGVTGAGRTSAAGGAGWIAWPPDGLADYVVLENLAADQVGTVILDSSVMPPANGAQTAPAAVTTTPDGETGQLRVLLADHTLSSSIASMPAGQIPGTESLVAPGQPVPAPQARSSPTLTQASEFAQEQWFLAETAMMAAQTPSVQSVVVAPDRRWGPSSAVAAALLKETVHAPWLKPVPLASLAAAQPVSRTLLRHPAGIRVSRLELRRSVLRSAQHLSMLLQMQGSILYPQVPDYLEPALAAVESSAWRGGSRQQRQALDLARQLTSYMTTQLSQVHIIPSLRVTLAGKSGFVPVTIRNRLAHTVSVTLHVSAPAATVGTLPRGGVVQVPGGAQLTVKVPIQKAPAGTTTLTMWLTTPDGRKLPGVPATVTVEATQFGTLAIVIIGVALLVFVVTAAARAIRQGAKRAPAAGGPDSDELNLASPLPQTGTVEADQSDDAHPSKGPDDHASTPGRSGQTGPARRG